MSEDSTKAGRKTGLTYTGADNCQEPTASRLRRIDSSIRDGGSRSRDGTTPCWQHQPLRFPSARASQPGMARDQHTIVPVCSPPSCTAIRSPQQMGGDGSAELRYHAPTCGGCCNARLDVTVMPSHLVVVRFSQHHPACPPILPDWLRQATLKRTAAISCRETPCFSVCAAAYETCALFGLAGSCFF